MTNLKDFYIKVCRLIEEWTNDNQITDDEDIRAKLPVLTMQGITKILQVKPIVKFAILPATEASEQMNFSLFELPEDLYQIRVVMPKHIDYRLVGDGNNNYLRYENSADLQDVYIEYEAFHPTISITTPIAADENKNFIIELTDDCIPILENFVAMGLTIESSELYGHFFEQYQSGMANLTNSRSKKLVEFMN
ncbi:MAG: hypothetical protein FWE47_00040 [Oscillospiraceae bacterium]|nr:hypothetical protein [Oscillospiraceae bacterium]